MQRRNSTRSSNGLGHQKSTSSAKGVHLEHILPELAERDAQAAAMQAFARAQDRRAPEVVSLWPPPRYNGGLGATKNHNNTEGYADNSPTLHHQQSVRFVRPRPPPAPRANTSAGETREARGVGSNDWTQTPRVAVEPRFENNTFASGMASAAKGTAGDYINALITSEEYYTPEDDIASAPSSYRRVRKSRSMTNKSGSSTYAGFQRGHYTSDVTNDWPQPPNIMDSESSENKPAIGLKAPKSMSFLRSRRGPYASSTGQESTFFGSRSPGDKLFKKSLRDVSNGARSMTLRVPKDGSMRIKARKASQNFRHKFKNLFNLGKEEKDDTAFPPQQVQARETHNTEFGYHSGGIGDAFRVDCPTDEGAWSRVTSGVPSLHAVPSNQQLRSRQGSVESLRSERKVSDEKSRVTSWGNSDTNTVTTVNSLKRDWERQRLSIIKENGMHISSSSARPTPGASQLNQPHPICLSSQLPKSQLLPTIDGQRIYSALMKRVNGKQRQPQHNDFYREQSMEDVRTTGAVPPRDSSYNRGSHRPETAPTIRHVVPGDNSSQESVRTTGTVITPSNFQRREMEYSSQVRNGSTQENKPLPTPLGDKVSKVESKDGKTLTDSERKPLFAQNLSARKSLFFGSPTCHLFRARSPYRRALQGSMREAAEAPQPKSPEFNPWTFSLNNLPLRCPSTCESEEDQKMQYAESIYSCDAEDPKNTLSQTIAVNQDDVKMPSIHGEATIFTDPLIYRPSPPKPPVPPKERVTSSDSSVEWKTWLSANVSKLEGSPARSEDNVVDYKLLSISSPSRHVRENAQIYDEDNEKEELDVYQPTGPSTAQLSTKHNAKLSTYLPRPMSKSRDENSSFDKENEAPWSPPIPPRNVLRVTSSSANLKSGMGKDGAMIGSSKHIPVNSTPRKTLAHMRSLNALGGNQPWETPNVPSKLPRRPARPIGYVAPRSSPGIAAAVDKQFRALDERVANPPKRSAGPTATTTAIKTENVSPRVGGFDKELDDYEGSGILGPEMRLGPRGSGSKRMVDLFLNSRRRRMASGEDGDGTVFL